jgi:hypothetical protein
VGLAFLAEALGAFALMWAVMGTAVNPRARPVRRSAGRWPWEC